MGVLWTGAAAGVRLYAGDETTVWAGIYRVDWSIHGAGSVFALWLGEQVRVIGTDRALSEWLNDTFMGPMNRSAALGGVAWEAVAYEEAEVAFDGSPESGARVRAGEITLELAEPLERELIFRDPYLLDGTPYRMSFVNVPCATGVVSIGGERLPGLPRQWADDQGRPRSTAQLAVAESWAL